MPEYKQTYTYVFSPSNQTFLINIKRLNRVLAEFFTVMNKKLPERRVPPTNASAYKSQTQN